ncbi:MAG: YegS/Rv2252/BmrU family lipid kinase [Clostridiaceae bacterium]|nr:YegS/Rv2252/BmrU family lipid kinase [Clostridiaceae bacterium]
MKKMLFVYNPMAGKEQIKNKLSDIVQVFCKADFDVTIFATQGAGDATRIVLERGEEFDFVVCSGGDGTMNEMASGLVQLEKKPVCGYIPAGTVNDFASSLCIPKIMKKAAKLITEGTVFCCDLGQFNDRYFTYVSGFGAFTEVSYQTPQEWKKLLGKTAYFIEALKHITMIKEHHMKVEYNDQVIEDDFILGLVSNSVSVAGYKAYSKMDLMMDDGLFEVLFIKSIRNPLELQATLNALLSKKFDGDRMLWFRSDRIKITSDDEVQWTLDGEDGGVCKQVTMINHQYALPIVCDKKIMKGVSHKYIEKKELGREAGHKGDLDGEI